jgi:hypothetical protein
VLDRSCFFGADQPKIAHDRLQASIGMSRCDLTDFEWRVIEPPLPNKTRGDT